VSALVYTFSDAARLLSCSVRTLERRVERGDLHETRVLGLRRIPASEIARVLGIGAQPQSREERDAERIAREMVR
jgi:excisionase family DNA binding protein